jgi:hypothetical protein
MDWRRVALWLCLAVVLIGSIVLIARVSMRTFSSLSHSRAMLNSAVPAACPIPP